MEMTTAGTTVDAQVGVALSMLEAAGAARGLVYVATPITTGRSVLESLAGGRSVSETDRAHARANNHAKAKLVADAVRRRLPTTLVVNPAEFEAATGDWAQENFYALWADVITRFARRIVVVEGWEFSKGARLEVQLALDCGIPVLDEGLFELSDKSVLNLTRRAEERLIELGESVSNSAEKLGPKLHGRSNKECLTNFVIEEQAAVETYWWLAEERSYQRRKFSSEFDDRQTVDDPQGLDSPWFERIGQYVKRSSIYGLDNDRGRQALAKAAATCAGWVESVVRVYGSLPQPGVASGDGIDPSLDSRHQR